MNKKLIFAISAVVAVIIGAFGFAACSGNGNKNKKPPKAPDGMLSPRVISFGTFISWDEVEGADIYEIYRDGKVENVTCDTFYRLGELTADAKYSVVVKNTETGETADKSNEASVSKNCNYSDSEILNLTNRNGYVSRVAAGVRKIVIGGEYRSSFNLEVILDARTNDIVFELKNVDITGYVTTADGSYKRAENDYNVIFKLAGNCSIKGENGSDGFDYSDSIYDNLEIDAGSGGDGGNVLILSSVVVCGRGNLTLSGGNGGNGGVGSSTTKWEAKNGPGAGADGGNGGTAIKCAYIVADFDGADCKVNVTDGAGGKKGVPGVNGSIVTGPMASAMWKDMYDIGKAGKNGKSVIGVKKIITGGISL